MTPSIDSSLTIDEALVGKEVPKDIREKLVLLDILHMGYDAAVHQGEPALAAFKDRGWTWGGDWQDIKDWQHLEKTEQRA